MLLKEKDGSLKNKLKCENIKYIWIGLKKKRRRD